MENNHFITLFINQYNIWKCFKLRNLLRFVCLEIFPLIFFSSNESILKKLMESVLRIILTTSFILLFMFMKCYWTHINYNYCFLIHLKSCSLFNIYYRKYEMKYTTKVVINVVTWTGREYSSRMLKIIRIAINYWTLCIGIKRSLRG